MMVDLHGNYTVERLLDRAQIKDALYRLVRAVDRRDYEAIGREFHPDAIDDHIAYCGDVAGYIEFSRSRNEKISASMHLLGNMLIEFAEPDVALVETYIWSVQRYAPDGDKNLRQFLPAEMDLPVGAASTMGCARYVDVFERRDSAWKIKRRTVMSDWRHVMPASEANVVESLKPSRRSKDDWYYHERRALGLDAQGPDAG